MIHASHSQVFVILILTSLQATFAVGSDTGKANAISSGLRYLAESGEAWKEKRGCVSCHQIPPMLWAMNLAHNYALSNAVPSKSKDLPTGINATDETTSDDSTTDDEPPTVTPTTMSIEDWNAWSVDVVNFVKPPQKATCNIEETMTGNIDTMAGLLLASPSTAAGDWKERFAKHLVSQQADDGSWNPCGQLPAQRREASETRLATTLWVALALEQERVDYARAKVNQLLSEAKAASTTEILALRLMLAKQFTNVDIDDTLRQLSNSQNDDGGWGWKLDEPSDALGTGYALFALRTIGQKLTDNQSQTLHQLEPLIAKAEEYLIKSQQPDGRWRVPGTKTSANGKHTATANDWGSAWAVIALIKRAD